MLKTIACWLTIQPEIETSLDSCSPCRLPGEQNRVLAWLKRPLDLDQPARAAAPERGGKAAGSASTTRQASAGAGPGAAHRARNPALPGHLRAVPAVRAAPAGRRESRALELYQALTGYPVTDDLRHICRNCQRSVLLPAMHTLEHAVDARYPSVALGDRSDIGAFTTLGHACHRLANHLLVR